MTKSKKMFPAPQISLEQIHALTILNQEGSIAAASRASGRTETQLIYALRTFENSTNLPLIDRSAYRTQLTTIGKLMAEKCALLLGSYQDLERISRSLQSGWEPNLAVVFDGIISPSIITDAIGALKELKAPTRITLYSEFHSEVYERSTKIDADIILAVIPFSVPKMTKTKIGTIPCHLVARKGHPAVSKITLKGDELSRLPLLTVRGSDSRLQLETGYLSCDVVYHMSDFQTKKQAILEGLGYGWLPEYLIRSELIKKQLQPVRWEGASKHIFDLWLFHRLPDVLGPAAKSVIANLRGQLEREKISMDE